MNQQAREQRGESSEEQEAGRGARCPGLEVTTNPAPLRTPKTARADLDPAPTHALGSSSGHILVWTQALDPAPGPVSNLPHLALMDAQAGTARAAATINTLINTTWNPPAFFPTPNLPGVGSC